MDHSPAAFLADGEAQPDEPALARIFGDVPALAAALERAEARLRALEEHARVTAEINPLIPWTADSSGQVTDIGERWFDLTGYTPADACAQGWRAAVHPDDLPALTAAIERTATSRVPYQAEFRMRMRDGSLRWMRARAKPLWSADGGVERWYGFVEDVHDRVAAEQAKALGEERLRLAVRSTALGIWDYDVATGARDWSPELRAMFGVPDGTPPDYEAYLALVHPQDRDAVRARQHAAMRGDLRHMFRAEYRIVRADTGAVRWVSTFGHILRDGAGRPVRVIVTFRDVTDRREEQERLLWAAQHDALTGLANRALFSKRLGKLVERAKPFGLLLLDLDHLKRVNDTLGHDGGDAVLKGAADRLLAAAGGEAVNTARLGGDEFGLILPGVSSRDALAEAAENLRGRLAEPLVVDGRGLDAHASIGGALFPDHGRGAGALLKSADVALYAAKTEGRGRAELYDRRLRAGVLRRAGMVKRAREALAAGRVEPHYQPKVDLKSGRVVGFEALLRWRDGAGRLRPPADLQAAFEDWNVAAELSDRMLARVVSDMARWRGEGVAFGRVAVNVSNAEFVRGDLTGRVLDRLELAGLPADRLELELTETVLLGDRGVDVERTLHELADAGVRVALDDFGTGFASLVHLRRFPIHVIKIDRSFTAGVCGDAGAAAIVRALVGLGRDLGIETVAEGVETSDQFRWLHEVGCTLGQGYLFGRAQSAELVPPMLR
ncbi:putative bifunctional diguanylate cyclase/phosphodiesterase [Sphingomonas lenta]|uniref:putative bifunctional diguanylate cyclase/phosphodiesterase n=1 Tax=Sphingomonas lenta TaxID=1141887 RepID=UPI0015955C8E|nr:GGDEF domain-containing phosphodiesterase [Sphingomonas lenta]